MDEHVRFANTDLWEQQQEVHKPRLEDWSCGCTCYRRSPYHICKHLIRLYIGEEGLRSNKPPMPFYGQVWRQSSPPLLWVAGKHDPSLLRVHDLQRQPENPVPEAQPLPILASSIANDDASGGGSILDDINQTFTSALRLEPALCDSEDEYQSDYEEDWDEAEHESGVGGDGEGDIAQNREDGSAGKSHGEMGRSEADAEDDEWDYGVGDTGFGDDDDAEDEDEDAMLFSQHEARGEAIMEGVELLDALAMRLRETFEDLRTYPLTHPHLRELPQMTPDNIHNVFKWSENWHKLKHVRNMPGTWDPMRKGNMFM